MHSLNMHFIDLNTLKFFNQSLYSPFATGLFSFASSPYPYVIFALLLFLVSFKNFPWQKTLSIIVLTALIVGFCDVVCTYYFKRTFFAVRPCAIYDWVIKPPKCSGSHSFPSNHSINIASLVGCFLLTCKYIYSKKTFLIISILSVFTAFVVGASRVYFAQHRPSEALMGLILGFYISWFIIESTRIFKTTHAKEKTRNTQEDTVAI